MDWEDDFDAVVLGHIETLQRISSMDIKSIIYDHCKRYGKNLIVFDPDLYPEESFIYSIKIDEEYVVNDTFDKLNLIEAPVVGVYGTSSRQGKFTVQLFLREIFSGKGYHVGQLGTEPSALLFGFDEAFPMGYNGGVSLEGYKAVLYLNKAMKRIQDKNPDIIITGAQSGTTLYWPGNLKHYPVHQTDMLWGTLPDAVVLCVNTYDEIHYIQRTIHLIESVYTSKVAALCLYPFEYLNDWNMMVDKRTKCSQERLSELKRNLSKQTGLPCFEIADHDDMHKLCVRLISFFSGEA